MAGCFADVLDAFDGVVVEVVVVVVEFIVAADQRWWVLVLFTRFETVEFPLLFFLPFLTRWKIC